MVQYRQSLFINRADTSISRSAQLDTAIPASKIAAFSSGRFVGMAADNPGEKIKLKMFHAQIINDNDTLNAEIKLFRDIPVVVNVTQQQVMDNYFQVKMDIKMLIEKEVGKLQKQKSKNE